MNRTNVGYPGSLSAEVKDQGMKKAATVASLLIVTAGVLAACSSSSTASPGDASPPNSYLCYGGSGASNGLLLQWPANGGVVTGVYREAQITGSTPNESLTASDGNADGQIHHGALEVTLGPHTLLGSISGTQLTLNVPEQDGTIQPVVCKQAGIAAWNQMVQQMTGQATSDNQKTLQQQEQQAQQQAQAQTDANNAQRVSSAQQSVTNDVATLASAAGSLDTNTTLAGDVNTMKEDLAKEQSDLTTAQQQDCASGAGTVSGDEGTVSGDAGTLSGDISSLQQNATTLSQDLSTVQTDVKTVSDLGAAPQTAPEPAIAQGQKALTDLTAAVQWAQSQSQSIQAQANQMVNQAKAIPGNGNC